MSTSARIREQIQTMAGGLPRPFWVLWTGTLINRMGTFVVPFLALYLTQARGFSVAQAGVVAGLYGLGAAVAAPVGGYLADHIGRRFTMVGALGLGGTCMVALGFAKSIAVIAPATFVVALISDMYRPGVQAAMADLVPPKDRVRAFGLIYWVINLGFAFGTALAGFLATVSFKLLFIGDGLASILYAFLIWRGVPETRPERPAYTAERPRPSALSEFLAPYRDRVYMAFVGLNFLSAVLFMQFTLTLPIDMTAHGISKAMFGSIIALNGVVIVFVQPFLGPWLAPRDRSRVIAAGVALMAVGFGLNAVVHTAPLYALGVVIWTIGEIGVLPIANAVVADMAPVHVRGRYQGAYSLSFGAAAYTAPTLGSIVLQHWGSTTLWTGAFVLGIVVAAGQLALRGRLERARRARRDELLAGA